MEGAPVDSPVVVADDDELARELVVRHLRKLNLRNRLLQAADGAAARAGVESLEVAPCLVLLDLDMPVSSGLDVLRWLRTESAFPHVPVVMLTASATLDYIDEAYRLGIASYLVKPVGFATLHDVLCELALPWALLEPVIDGGPG